MVGKNTASTLTDSCAQAGMSAGTAVMPRPTMDEVPSAAEKPIPLRPYTTTLSVPKRCNLIETGVLASLNCLQWGSSFYARLFCMRSARRQQLIGGSRKEVPSLVAPGVCCVDCARIHFALLHCVYYLHAVQLVEKLPPFIDVPRPPRKVEQLPSVDGISNDDSIVLHRLDALAANMARQVQVQHCVTLTVQCNDIHTYDA